MKIKKNLNAFTLVELVVAITILSILGIIAFLNLQFYSLEARDSKRLTDISELYKKISTEEIKGVEGSSLINNIETKSVVINNSNEDTIQGTPKFSLLKLNEEKYKDPLTKQDYVLSYIVGGFGFESYKFTQISTVSEATKEAVVRGNYFIFNKETDSPSIIKNNNNQFIVDGLTNLPYAID